MKASKILLGLFVAQALYLFAAQPIFCQTERLDITNAFCILTVYASTASAGSHFLTNRVFSRRNRWSGD